jgi:hypothetical protein
VWFGLQEEPPHTGRTPARIRRETPMTFRTPTKASSVLGLTAMLLLATTLVAQQL